MNIVWLVNILRFFSLVAVQILVLKALNISPYVQVFLYPLFILHLPFRTPTWALLLLGALIGLTIDVFYDTLGIHMAASVLIAYLRPLVCRILEPRGGYEGNQRPNRSSMGLAWFMRYSGILFFLFYLYFFLLQAFSFVALGYILLKVIFSFFVTGILVLIYQYLPNPKI
jgi:hypothetical protein